MRLVSALVCVAVCTSALPAAAFDFSDARRMVAIADPQISPDASRVVYVHGVPDFANDRNDRQLMLIDVRTHVERRTHVGSPGRFLAALVVRRQGDRVHRARR